MGELIQIPLASSSDTAVLSFEDVPVKEEGDTNESHELVVRSYVARKLRIPLVNLFGQPEAVKHLETFLTQQVQEARDTAHMPKRLNTMIAEQLDVLSDIVSSIVVPSSCDELLSTAVGMPLLGYTHMQFMSLLLMAGRVDLLLNFVMYARMTEAITMSDALLASFEALDERALSLVGQLVIGLKRLSAGAAAGAVPALKCSRLPELSRRMASLCATSVLGEGAVARGAARQETLVELRMAVVGRAAALRAETSKKVRSLKHKALVDLLKRLQSLGLQSL